MPQDMPQDTRQALTIYQRDAFTRAVFRGNPAAVVPLPAWPPDAVMQAVAAENNLAETAFLVPRPGEEGAQPCPHYGLRWFTPTQEVDLCGHATLAAASVVLDLLAPGAAAVTFHTASGPLVVRRDGAEGRLAMDFPCRPPAPVGPPALLRGALGAAPVAVLAAPGDTNLYAVFDAEAQVRALAPDLALLARLPPVAVTAPGDAGEGAEGGVDFVSRYFAPSYGIPEDPVTGSTHCALVPYWAARLGRTALHARQVSARGGDLFCALVRGPSGDRVVIAGHVAPYLEGRIWV